MSYVQLLLLQLEQCHQFNLKQLSETVQKSLVQPTFPCQKYAEPSTEQCTAVAVESTSSRHLEPNIYHSIPWYM